jgi:ABC-type polar amino acid transport system ATPase subunit
MEMALRVKELTHRFPGATAPVLEALSFEIHPGQLTAILGPSGAGKTTLLRCAVGLEPFERGTIQVDSVQVLGTEQVGRSQRESSLRALRDRVGLVFQAFELFPHLTVMENCALAPVRVKGQPREQVESRAETLLEQLGLTGKELVYPERLSGGQRQRVAIARALMMEPTVLFYDEPTSALDEQLKQEVFQTLMRVDATGVTQIVVTHDVRLARGAEWVLILDHGRIIEAGEPEDVLENPSHESTRKLLASWPSGRKPT